uniref:ABC transporter substrate-binding protein n=1 Tax=Pantoea sp. IMH TaxID=1267600 RepID=UPI0004680ACD|nr:ABC transporter substrate-binding protein [Pantoea sp. IMH]
MRRHLMFLLLLSSFSAGAAAFPVTVNSCGKPVTFDRPPERAIINDLNMAEMAFALNLQDRIIGLTGISGWYKMTEDFNQRRGEIPELAPKYPSLETLLAARPDFFFAGWNYGMKPGGDVTPETLRPFGIATFVLSESCIFTDKPSAKASMALLYNDQITLGKIFGKEKEARRLTAQWKQRLSALPMRPAGARPANVFIYDSGEEKPFTSGRYAMPTAIVEAAGGHNVMDNLQASWTTTSWEHVATTEPDLIVLLDYQSGSGADALQRFLESHPLMKRTPAVKQKRYLKLRYEELTPGPANIDAVEKLARSLYGKKPS